MVWVLVNWFNFSINKDKLSVGEKQLIMEADRQTKIKSILLYPLFREVTIYIHFDT